MLELSTPWPPKRKRPELAPGAFGVAAEAAEFLCGRAAARLKSSPDTKQTSPNYICDRSWFGTIHCAGSQAQRPACRMYRRLGSAKESPHTLKAVDASRFIGWPWWGFRKVY